MSKNLRIQNFFLEKEQDNGDWLSVEIDLYLNNTAIVTTSKVIKGVANWKTLDTTNLTKEEARDKYRSLTRLGFTLTSNTKVCGIAIDSGPDQAWDGEPYLRTYLGLVGEVFVNGNSVDIVNDFEFITSYDGGLTEGLCNVAEKWAARISKALGSNVEVLNDALA